MTYDPIDTNDDGVVDADVDNQSVSTERVSDAETGNSYAPETTFSRGLSPWAAPKATATRSQQVPTFERVGENPILSLSDFPTWAPVDLSTPSVVPTDHLTDPATPLRLYLASHDTDGAGLVHLNDPVTVDSIDGSNPMMADDREGSVFWDHKINQYVSYRNTQNENIARWESTDGISWTRELTEITTNFGHAGAPHAMGGRRGYYLYLSAFAEVNDTRRAAVAHSDDGLNGWNQPRRIEYQSRVEPSGGSDTNVGNSLMVTDVMPYDSGALVAYKDQVLLDSGSLEVRLGYSPDGVRVQDLGPMLDNSDGQAWEDGEIGDVSLFWWNGQLWACYVAGAGQTTRSGVGMARATFGAWR